MVTPRLPYNRTCSLPHPSVGPSRVVLPKHAVRKHRTLRHVGSLRPSACRWSVGVATAVAAPRCFVQFFVTRSSATVGSALGRLSLVRPSSTITVGVTSSRQEPFIPKDQPPAGHTSAGFRPGRNWSRARAQTRRAGGPMPLTFKTGLGQGRLRQALVAAQGGKALPHVPLGARFTGPRSPPSGLALPRQRPQKLLPLRRTASASAPPPAAAAPAQRTIPAAALRARA